MRMPRHGQGVMLVASSGFLLLGLLLLASAHSPAALANPGDLFVTQAGMGTTCSQAAPCALVTAIGKAIAGDTIYVAEGTYKGAGDAVITVTKSITLYGGWDGAPSGQVTRDPAAHPSTLNGEWARRVLYISGNITPTIDGFVIAHGNASGLCDTWPSNADGCGGGIYIVDAHPIISHNVITNTTPTSSTISADHTLFWGNAHDGIRGTNPVDGDPKFVNPANADFHLSAGSAAIDTGIATWVTTDIDGDQRPMRMGYDIGADEARYLSLLPMITKH